MGEFHCDRCQGGLLANEDVRYKVHIQVSSVYDVMELNPRELAERDFDAELKSLIKAIEKRTAEELESEVYKEFHFDLCLRCQRNYIADPLGLTRSGEQRTEEAPPHDP